jgi:nucleotide-sensitive chloride channel 1A
VDTIFEALSYCASLHPDKFDDEGMDDGVMMADDNSPFEFFTGDGDEELSEVGKVRSDFINNNRFTPY